MCVQRFLQVQVRTFDGCCDQWAGSEAITMLSCWQPYTADVNINESRMHALQHISQSLSNNKYTFVECCSINVVPKSIMFKVVQLSRLHVMGVG
jgi:hypothetical protein